MESFVADDGLSVAYRDEGRGPPILMLHGLNADSRLFADQAGALADRFRVIRPDFRAHGETPAGDAPDMARLAGDVAALARHLDLTGIVGVGWSLGAMVLWRVLLGVEAWRFAGHVTIDMTARITPAPGWSLGLRDPDLRLAPANEAPEARGARIAAAILSPQADPALAERIAPLLVQADVAGVAAIGASLFEEDFRRLLPRIAVPAIVAHGARSQYYAAAAADHVAALLPDARVHRFAASGHAPHVEERDAFNAMLADFATACAKTQDIRTGRMMP